MAGMNARDGSNIWIMVVEFALQCMHICMQTRSPKTYLIFDATVFLL